MFPPYYIKTLPFQKFNDWEPVRFMYYVWGWKDHVYERVAWRSFSYCFLDASTFSTR